MKEYRGTYCWMPAYLKFLCRQVATQFWGVALFLRSTLKSGRRRFLESLKQPRDLTALSTATFSWVLCFFLSFFSSEDDELLLEEEEEEELLLEDELEDFFEGFFVGR